jgi:hypothetical protein
MKKAKQMITHKNMQQLLRKKWRRIVYLMRRWKDINLLKYLEDYL